MESFNLVGVVLHPHEKGEYEFVYKGSLIRTYSNVLFIYCPYPAEDDEVLLWFNGTNNIEKVVRYGEE
jgi:hypothetical protein